MHDQDISTLPPLFYGRLARMLAGFITAGVVLFVGREDLGGWGFWGLVFLGLSFFIAGLFAVPGCEITAIPNLLLPKTSQIHCFCPIFTPIDKLEHSLQQPPDEALEPK